MGGHDFVLIKEKENQKNINRLHLGVENIRVNMLSCLMEQTLKVLK